MRTTDDQIDVWGGRIDAGLVDSNTALEMLQAVHAERARADANLTGMTKAAAALVRANLQLARVKKYHGCEDAHDE